MNAGTDPLIDYSKIGVLPGGIPKLAHCFWTGSQMPRTFRTLLDRFRAIHPGWHVRVWCLESLPVLLNQRAFSEITKLAYKADVLRYELVARFPGVWMDLDINWLRPLDRLIGHCEAFGGRERSPWINNAIFGAAPGHPWVWALVDRLDRSYSAHKEYGGLPKGVGVQYFNEVQADFKSSVTVFHPGIFHPFQGDQLLSADLSDHPTAHGLHFYSSADTTGKVQQAIDARRIRIPTIPELEAGATIQIDADSLPARARSGVGATVAHSTNSCGCC